MMNDCNILHYTIGLNKNRGGGLTKYVDDLSNYQSINNNVIILYPGEYGIFNKKIKIKEEKPIGNKKIYSIKNPLSLPMMFGLKDFDYLNKKSDIEMWKKFLITNNVSIIHMHTLMGIYSEFILAAHELKIPLIYTTHDYFGLCSKQTLVFNGKICNNWESCTNCPLCNSTAFPKWKTFLIHSRIFFVARKFEVFKKLKSKAKKVIDTNNQNSSNCDVSYYKNLRKKMIELFNLMDTIHFNSSITEFVFRKAIPNINGEVINLVHNDILDNRTLKEYSSDILRVTYLGPTTKIKGFDDVINAMDKIYLTNKKIELNIYSYTEIDRPYLKKNGVSYKYSDLKEIFEKSDVLVAVSKNYETFGFTVSEALSYGVPAIVSDTLGAKDMIKNGLNGYIIKSDELVTTIGMIANNKKKLQKMNKYICDSSFYNFEDHCKDIYRLYKKNIDLKKNNIEKK